MNDQSKVIDQEGNDVLDPRKALADQTLAVDLARVEFDQAIATAHKFPRSIDTVIKKIGTLACYNKDAAENCVYALPRGGKPIIGPSIGFASIVAQSWGNCRVAAQITYVDRKEKAVIAAGRFFDLETNTETIVPVSRRIVDSKGRLYNDDMIQVTGMAAASIGARNAILRGVSRGLWHPIWLDALQIVRGTVETFAETKARALAAMAQFGVAPDKIYMALGLKGEIELTLEHIPTMRGMYTQLRDGSTTVEEMFDPRRMTGKGFETVADPLGDGGAPQADAETETDPTVGMGEAPQKPAAETASAKPQEAQGELLKEGAAKPAAAKTDAPAASAEARPAEQPKTEQQKVPAAEPEAAKPTTAAEYLAFWAKFCEEATSATAISQKYAADRNLRKACAPWDEKQFAELNHVKAERLAELGK